MIDRKLLLADLKPLLKELEADLRARCDEIPEIDAGLKQEYEQAKDAGRTGAAFEAWRADLITQVAAAWVLSCVFVRFLEDNELISPPRISGPLHGAGEGRGMMRARDERDLYFRSHPTDTDRDYLLAVFADLAKLPGAKDIFGPHNPVSAYRDWLSGDAAQKLIEFFQKIDKDETGELIHDFTDPITPTGGWDTRFLGDLYQDLSEAARKKYALLQTPEFVEEFILERTLEPAINEFGLEGFKMIDPACGSGHFVLGSFARILARWRRQEPGTPDRELVNRSLAAVHGVDLNPYAVAIARFRLLIAAMRECQLTRLKDAQTFQFNLACGDSLFHGSPGSEQQVLGFHELAHAYQSEDLPELQRILQPGGYHAVVANPPYIRVKDKALNQAYRERYPEVCHRQYSVAVPFLQRLFGLACDGGYTGQITTNSFMKREFGKKLVESYLPKIDLTHVIDTSGAYIPGHGTPTVILFGRNRPPVAPNIRAVMGIKGEPATPQDPAKGLVWSAILDQIDRVGSQSDYVSVADTPRESFHRHPWSIGGGGAAELKEVIDEQKEKTLGAAVEEIGRTTVVGEDHVWIMNAASGLRLGIGQRMIPLVVGDCVRDWRTLDLPHVLYPYLSLGGEPIPSTDYAVRRYLVPFRSSLNARSVFGKTMADNGRDWWEHLEHYTDKLRTPLSIVFAFVATHNHFVLDRGGKVFKQSAPVIKLPADASEDDHLALLGLLNSSTACFWLQQTMHNKGGPGGGSSKDEKWHDFFEFAGTRMTEFPIPSSLPQDLGQRLDALAQRHSELNAADAIRLFLTRSDAAPGAEATTQADVVVSLRDAVNEAGSASDVSRRQMIAFQEELDWKSYYLYGLTSEDLTVPDPPAIRCGERAFEIVLARQVASGQIQTKWFDWLHVDAIVNMPSHWPEGYRKLVEWRVELVTKDRNIGLIEQVNCKRRWETEPWEAQLERASRNWLLDTLESYFDLDGRMNEEKQAAAQASLREPRLTSVAQVADLARKDAQFMQVAELYVGRMDFDITNLVDELITAQAVPTLPVLRYKPDGLDKRAAWGRTWDLQRLEDAIDAHFEVDRLKELAEAVKQGGDAPAKAAAVLPIEDSKRRQVAHELASAAGYVAEAVKQKLNLASDTIIKPIQDAVRRAKKAAVGDIPVPPKYKSADFLDSKVWRLRGKLDVHKERWVSFPHCEGEDGTLVIAWAGYDHLQLARAIAERYETAKEQEGRKLVPLLAAIGQLIPWLKQWHNDLDPTYGTRMGDYFENYLAEEAKAIGKTAAEVMAWTPPARSRKKRRATTKTRRRKEENKA